MAKLLLIIMTDESIVTTFFMGSSVQQLNSKLKELRAKRGWSWEDLVSEVGVSLFTIQRWESRGAKPYRLV
ncbi:helix-turn-helix domain-containing protein [Chloroflexota bacterium]